MTVLGRFPFPSNGKVYLKSGMQARMLSMALSFHSLQTGKCISSLRMIESERSLCGVSIPFKRESVSQVRTCNHCELVLMAFPFPSNGKVYLKIPGKRGWELSISCQGFHSLQTGTRIQSHIDSHPLADTSSFHSLQTGTRIQRLPTGQVLSNPD